MVQSLFLKQYSTKLQQKRDSACLQIKQNLDWITVETITNIEDRKIVQSKASCR